MKTLFKKFGFKKANLFILLLAFGIGLILPFPARALSLDWLATRIATEAVSLILQVVIWISGILLMLSSWLLNWVTSPNFIGVKFTNNPFVTPAWTLVRDFVNMGFIMALVIIGLGTALGRGEYQVQKTLPMLIIMALAINFTPVICGLFIDVSNIIMDFFLQGVNFDWAFRTIREMTIALSSTVTSEGFWEVIGAGIGMIAFNVIAALVFFAFAFLFAARYVALWILVILSPLAFFCYILPPTRKIWTQWWSQLIAWCFIGAQAAFWIYLAYQMMAVTGQITGAPPPDPEFQGITAIVGYIIPVLFLSFGLTASVATAAQGADMAVSAFNWTKGQVVKRGKQAGGWAGMQTLGRAFSTEKGQKLLRNMTTREYGYYGLPGSKSWLSAVERAKKSKHPRLGMAGVIGGTLLSPLAYPLQWTMRKTAKAGIHYGITESKEIDKIKKKFEEQYPNWEDAAAVAQTIAGRDWRERIAMAQYLAEKKGAKALGKLPKNYLADVISKTAKYTPDKLADLVKHFPELIDPQTDIGKLIIDKLVAKGAEDEDVKELVKVGYDVPTAIIKAAYKKAVGELKTKDIETLSDKSLENSDVQEMIARYKPKDFIRKIYEEKGTKIGEAMTDKINDIGAKQLIQTNPGLVRACVYDTLYKNLVGPLKGAETKTQFEILQRLTKSSKLMEYNDTIEQASSLKKTIEKSRRQGINVQAEEQDYNQTLAELRDVGKTFTDKEKELWHQIQVLKKRI